jgi:glycosyltransferase involved in cell wall biosynthesis
MTLPAPPNDPSADCFEVTVVIPCLNEERTVGHCVSVAIGAMRAAGLPGEVIVADNGSRDASRERAAAAGAQIVTVARRGYGSALMAGITAARGRFVIMGDADASYDFASATICGEVARQLRSRAGLPPARGRHVARDAMPWSHRWIGNPALSLLSRLFFRTGLNDI